MNGKIIFAIAALVATWLAMLVLGAGPVDRQILMALYAGSRPVVALIAIGFTTLGEWLFVVIVTLLTGAWIAYKGRRQLALLLVSGTLVSRALVIIQKYELGRLRPDEHLRLVEVSSKSFPSAHSANSMLVYPLCALLLAPPRWRRAAVTGAVLLSLCIGTSRVLLGVHWPSDVVAGWSFGALSAITIVQVQARLARRAPNQNRG